MRKFFKRLVKVKFPFSFASFGVLLGLIGITWFVLSLNVAKDQVFLSPFRLIAFKIGKWLLWVCFAALFLLIVNYIYALIISKIIQIDLQKSTTNGEAILVTFKNVKIPIWGRAVVYFFDKNNHEVAFCELDKKSKENGQKFMQSKILTGKLEKSIWEIKKYHLFKIKIMRADMLGLFRFCRSVAVALNFEVKPTIINEGIILSQMPSKLKDDFNHSVIPQKMEGEYLNYKNFENGDDTRRIVWQIYAKSRELIVRIPEEYDYFTAEKSVFIYFPKIQSLGIEEDDILVRNSYKNWVYTFYAQVANDPNYKIYLINKNGNSIKINHIQELEFALTTTEWGMPNTSILNAQKQQFSVAILPLSICENQITDFVDAQAMPIKLSNFISVENTSKASLFKTIFLTRTHKFKPVLGLNSEKFIKLKAIEDNNINYFNK